MLTSVANMPATAVDKGFRGNLQEWESIWAFAEAKNWLDKSVEFVITQWITGRIRVV